MESANRAACIAARDQVPLEIRNKWKLAFCSFDLKHNGLIAVEELKQVMLSMRMKPLDGEVESMIAAVDHDGDNAVNFDEFELMMVGSGRGITKGFSHVVDRHIKIGDVAKLITSECTNFVDRFCREHVSEYADLPPPGHEGEHQPVWYDTFKTFCEQAELTMQNVLILWGVASQKSFDEEFLENVEQSNLLDDFLKLTDYQIFVERMRVYVNEQNSGVPAIPMAHIARPMTPHTRAKTQQRLAELDNELAQLDFKRSQLLVERRRLIGCEVQPVTTICLKQELEARRWREDVGFD